MAIPSKANRVALIAMPWLIALLCAGGVVLVLVLAIERQTIEARERQHLQQQVRVINDNLSQQLEAMNRALEAVIDDAGPVPVSAEHGQRTERRLKAFSRAMIGVRTMIMMDARGNAIAASRDGLVGRNFSERAYFRAARSAASPDTLVISPPYTTSLNVWAITLARVMVDAQGNFAGIVTATLDPGAFTTLLESVRYTSDVSVTLAHGDGLRFLRVGQAAGLADPDMARPGSPLSRHLQSGAASHVFTDALVEGGPVQLMAIHTVQPAALQMDKPLLVVVARSRAAVFAGWQDKAVALAVAYLVLALLTAGWLRSQQQRRLQRLKQEQELAAMNAGFEARWRVVLEATSQGVWDWDTVTDKVFFSPVWKAMLGYAKDEVGDSLQEWRSRVHPDDMEQAQQALQAHLKGESGGYEHVYRMRHRNGNYLWIHDRGGVVERDAQARPLRVIGSCTDVSQQRQQQQTLDRLTANVPGALYQYQREADGHSFFPYASTAIQDIYACRPEELQRDASPVFACIHPDDRQAVSNSIQQSARTLEVWLCEYRVLLPGRGERWISGRARPELLASGAVLWHGYLQDVTEAKQQAIQLQETERLLRHLMQEMPIGLLMVDGQGQAYYVNRHFRQLCGYSLDELSTPEQWWLLAYPDADQRARARQAWAQAVAQAENNGGYIPDQSYTITTREGLQRTLRIGGITFGNHFLATLVDDTEQQAENAFFRGLAYNDGLTGLANRRRFDELFEAEWQRCRRSQRPLAVLMIDIDQFKRYNDTYGHPQGDICLQQVADVLRQGCRRSHDLVARYGGEEFVCLLPECDLDAALAQAQALRKAVEQRGIEHRNADPSPVVTISIGVACRVPDAQSTPQQLLAMADASLYRAKAAGRNCVDAGAL